ncbi:unnamed protein product, partial [Brassica oleracea var. botrytis]
LSQLLANLRRYQRLQCCCCLIDRCLCHLSPPRT